MIHAPNAKGGTGILDPSNNIANHSVWVDINGIMLSEFIAL